MRPNRSVSATVQRRNNVARGAGGAGQGWPGGELPPQWRDLLAPCAALGDGGTSREGEDQPGFADTSN